MKYFLYIGLMVMLFSCTHKSSNDEIDKYKYLFRQDKFALRGDYHWNFQLMGSTQQSVHTIYADSITYSMKGKVYSTTYTMQKLSFDSTKNKWIGRDENGIVYVLFFKDKTDSTVTIYKHKCKNNGLKEAVEFDVPKPDATEDHGWNVYALNQDDVRDVLAVQGDFSSKEHTVKLADDYIYFDDNSFSKLSYHAGERRWVGQKDSVYLQVFFRDFDTQGNELELSVAEHKNLEDAYQTKYSEVSFSKYAKQKE